MPIKTKAKVIVECEYFTRPGAKKEYRKTVFYKRNKSAKEKIDQYSGSVEVSASYKDLAFEVSSAINTSWNNTHSFSTSTEDEEMTSNESLREYYDGVTLLVRSLKFKYFIDNVCVENTVETIVLNLKENYSVDRLYQEAKKYMEMTYGVKNTTTLQIPILLEKKEIELYVKWKPFKKGDVLPKDAVYGGTTAIDGAVYVARFENTPGKVTIDSGKVHDFWVHGYFYTKVANGSPVNPGDYWKVRFSVRRNPLKECSGEILVTNGNCNWVRIRKGDLFPQNAMYAGLDKCAAKVWVGKADNGEPGCIICDGNSKMFALFCPKGDHHEGYVLTIS